MAVARNVRLAKKRLVGPASPKLRFRETALVEREDHAVTPH
jgi:hypothetical protein